MTKRTRTGTKAAASAASAGTAASARGKLSKRDARIITKIERIRRNTNVHWMGIVRLVMRYARPQARALFEKIEENDRKIYLETRKLAR